MIRNQLSVAVLFVICSLSCSTSIASAQDALIGIHAGATIYDPSTDGQELLLSAKEGLVIGGVAEFRLLQELGFRAGIDYSLRQAKFTTTSGTNLGTYKLTYLNLPINLKFRFGGESLGFYVFGGTTLGALLSATTDGTGGEIDDSLKSVDISADLGGGVDIGLTEDWFLNADVTYSFGLLDIAEESFIGKWKARTLKAVIGVNYRIF
jgi:opacity protein-like surface antigen